MLLAGEALNLFEDKWILSAQDFSKQNLKAVLLHNRNKYPSILLAQSVHLKVLYDNIELLLEAAKYKQHQWSVCGGTSS